MSARHYWPPRQTQLRCYMISKQRATTAVRVLCQNLDVRTKSAGDDYQNSSRQITRPTLQAGRDDWNCKTGNARPRRTHTLCAVTDEGMVYTVFRLGTIVLARINNNTRHAILSSAAPLIRRRLDVRATSWEQPIDVVFQRRIAFLLSTPIDVVSTSHSTSCSTSCRYRMDVVIRRYV